MSEFSQKWAIVSLLDDAPVGSVFHYTDFPLHITLAGVFAIDKSGKEISSELIELLAGQRSIAIQADERAKFGPGQDISVMKVKQSTELMALYEIIYSWLTENKAVFNAPEYQGEGYIPHCTDQKSNSLKPGESRILHSVSLIDMYPNQDGYQRKIYKTITLG